MATLDELVDQLKVLVQRGGDPEDAMLPLANKITALLTQRQIDIDWERERGMRPPKDENQDGWEHI
jgi:hypothetical protein